MAEKVLVCGGNGYIGNALVQRLLSLGYYVVSIDNDLKEKWAGSVKSESAFQTLSISEKIKKFNKISKFKYFRIDIAKEPDLLKQVLTRHYFKTIVNLAQQPSAAYSQISLKHAAETMMNNNLGTLNLLWLIKEINPDAHYIEIESMGCNQPDVNTDIPENLFSFIFNERYSAPSIFPKRPGSFYHSSKVNNTYLVDCAARFWNLKITAVNQGIVYGAYTPEIEKSKIYSPLWYDECFGTVVHRFIIQALLGKSLTVYGQGNQKRGFLALNDSVQCLELLIKNDDIKLGEVRFVNQLDEVFSIKEIAENVARSFYISRCIEYIDTPRVECTDDFYYNPTTDIIKSLGFKKTRSIGDEILFCQGELYDTKSYEKLKDVQLPTIKWRK